MSDDLKGIVLLKSYFDAIIDLDDDDRLELYDAIFNFGFKDQDPTFTKKYLNSQWILIKPNLVNSINRYKASTENGKKGGRPPKKKVADEPIDREKILKEFQEQTKMLDEFQFTGELYGIKLFDKSEETANEISAIIKEVQDKLNPLV